MFRLAPALALAFALLFSACAQGGGTDGGAGDGSVDGASDSGGDSTAPRDTGGRDTNLPGDMCDGITCEPFEECLAGTCVGFPACVSDSECEAGRICLHRFCIPNDRDVDGDGYSAMEDCDETNPDINPGQDEVCNLIDDNCSGDADDGNPGLMCAGDPAGGECTAGACGCPDGVFDVDGVPDNGCECMAMPATAMGGMCSAPIDAGSLADSGQTVTLAGNVLPEDREVWYRFRAIDGADTSCDNFHVRVRLSANPGEQYGFNVFHGDCGSAECDDTVLYGDYRWATDFRATVAGRLAGQCPCTGSGAARQTNVSPCTDDSGDYFVRVKRVLGSTPTCEPYALEISNGVYDS